MIFCCCCCRCRPENATKRETVAVRGWKRLSVDEKLNEGDEGDAERERKW